MIDKIVSRLATGSVKQVVARNGKTTPGLPYVAVWAELSGGKRYFTCAVHMAAGYQNALEDYVYYELSDLLKDFEVQDRHGNYVHIYDAEQINELPPVPEDSSIAMERIFYVPAQAY